MKEEKRITQADIDGAEVKLGPIAGVQPRVYLPIAYSLGIVLLFFLVMILPGLRNFGSYLSFSGAPEKAAIYVGNEYKGSSLAGIYLRAGIYSLRIEHEGFLPVTVETRVGGRLLGSLFFPRHQTVAYKLTAKEPRSYLGSAFSAYAAWSLAGKPSALYQIPAALSDAAMALASTGSLNAAFDNGKDRLAFIGDVAAATASAEAGRDGLKAAALVAAGGIPGPLSLAAAARSLLAATCGKPAAAALLNDILPRSDSLTRKAATQAAGLLGQKPKAQSAAAPRHIGTQTIAGTSFSLFSPGSLILAGEAPSGSFAPYAIEIPGFGLALTETTVGQWKQFLAAKPEWQAKNASALKTEGLIDDSYMVGFSLLSDNQPVTSISWYAAKAYCEWLTTRSGGAYLVTLPTEAMWEAAAWLPATIKNSVWSDSSPQGSQKVASFGYEASSGLADLFGNVWEWTSDSYYPYPALAGGFAEHEEKAVRGGSWANEASSMDLETRGGIRADHGSAFLGFRPALLRK